MKYKKNMAYRGTLPLSNVTIDTQYNNNSDLLTVKLLHNEYDERFTLTLNLTKKMREQLRDCLNVEFVSE